MYLDFKLLSFLVFALTIAYCSAVPVSEESFAIEEQEHEESSYAPKKTVKRGIYGGLGGYGYGLGYGHHYPYYSLPLYKGFYGGYGGHFPYFGLGGYHGYGGYGGFGYGW